VNVGFRAKFNICLLNILILRLLVILGPLGFAGQSTRLTCCGLMNDGYGQARAGDATATPLFPPRLVSSTISQCFPLFLPGMPFVYPFHPASLRGIIRWHPLSR
jgi:hypothetical protein